MKTFEIEFKTSIPNAEDAIGNWFNYYKADSREEAIALFHADMLTFRIKVIEVIAIREM